MTFNRVHRLTVLAIMVALDVLLTPLFRVEGMAFMSSVVNIIAGTFMTPLYAATMALIVAVIRILTQAGVASVAPLAILGTVPGAVLAAYFYRLTKKSIMSWVGEFLGTGIIGSILSAPVMNWYWTMTANGDNELLAKASAAQSLFLFMPRFICATLIGGALGLSVVHGLRYSAYFVNLEHLYLKPRRKIMISKAKMFDGYANAYDQWFMKNENVFASELKLLHRMLEPLEKKTILSIDCGSGLFESALKREYGIHVQYGVEPSTDMAKIARKRGMTVFIGDAETSELAENSYDVIYLNGCSSYIKNLSAAYQNCHRALKKGGHLILLDVLVESAYGILYKFAAHVGSYEKELFEQIAPTFPYPIELVSSAIFHSPLEKENILREELGMTNIRYFQTLTAQPIYTNDFVEEPIEGYDKGGYVALVAEK